MALGTSSFLKTQTVLQQLLEEINFQRAKEMRQLLKDDGGFVVLQGTTYWTDLFVRHFLFQSEPDHSIDSDDLLFFVRKKHVKGTSRHMPKYETEVDVFRKDSRKLPIGDPDVDWEETVYLNLIIHQFNYTLTLAICTRTSPKELQVLRRHSQRVYASPSRRKMDTKGEGEEMTYPHICFMVDNFDEVFSDIMVRDGEMVCVELVASDRDGSIQGVIFLGSIRYDALKKVYDARQSSLSSKVAQRMTFGLFNSAGPQTRCEFVRMKGPQGKGHAEMAVTKPKGSGVETPTSEPGFCATDMWDEWDEDPDEYYNYRHQRRLSDPSANLNNYSRYGWKSKAANGGGCSTGNTCNPNALDGFASAKARSENEGLDTLASELSEIEAGDLKDDRPVSSKQQEPTPKPPILPIIQEPLLLPPIPPTATTTTKIQTTLAEVAAAAAASSSSTSSTSSSMSSSSSSPEAELIKVASPLSKQSHTKESKELTKIITTNNTTIDVTTNNKDNLTKRVDAEAAKLNEPPTPPTTSCCAPNCFGPSSKIIKKRWNRSGSNSSTQMSDIYNPSTSSPQQQQQQQQNVVANKKPTRSSSLSSVRIIPTPKLKAPSSNNKNLVKTEINNSNNINKDLSTDEISDDFDSPACLANITPKRNNLSGQINRRRPRSNVLTVESELEIPNSKNLLITPTTNTVNKTKLTTSNTTTTTPVLTNVIGGTKINPKINKKIKPKINCTFGSNITTAAVSTPRKERKPLSHHLPSISSITNNQKKNIIIKEIKKSSDNSKNNNELIEKIEEYEYADDAVAAYDNIDIVGGGGSVDLKVGQINGGGILENNGKMGILGVGDTIIRVQGKEELPVIQQETTDNIIPSNNIKTTTTTNLINHNNSNNKNYFQQQQNPSNNDNNKCLSNIEENLTTNIKQNDNDENDDGGVDDDDDDEIDLNDGDNEDDDDILIIDKKLTSNYKLNDEKKINNKNEITIKYLRMTTTSFAKLQRPKNFESGAGGGGGGGGGGVGVGGGGGIPHDNILNAENDQNGNDNNNETIKRINRLNRNYSTLPKMKKNFTTANGYHHLEQRPIVKIPMRTTPDGTNIYYWCDLSKKMIKELDDGAYNPLWATRGFTQTFHFWKEHRRQQSTPLNAFLTYVTLPWWSIAKDLLDHRETPILTF